LRTDTCDAIVSPFTPLLRIPDIDYLG
jgi:hypothetical protein